MTAPHTFRAVAFLGTTIDGHIARADGSIDYLPPAPTPAAPATQIYPRPSDGSAAPSTGVPNITTMLSSSDVLVMGRATYETVTQPHLFTAWPYGNTPMVVLSSTPASISPRPGCSDIALPNIDSFLALSAERGYRNVWVDGGATVRSFLARGLLDELVLTTVPVVLGSGISLFGGLEREVACEVVAVEVVEGLVAVRYRVVYGEVDAVGRLIKTDVLGGT